MARSTIGQSGCWRLITLAAVTGVMLMAACFGWAQTIGESAAPAAPPTVPLVPAEPQASEMTPFEVVVLVTASGGTDTVTILFPWPMPHDQVASLVQRMGEVGGWEVGDLQIEDKRFVGEWGSAKQGEAEDQVQTLAEFTATGVINRRQRWINLDPFILGLREHSPLRIKLDLADKMSVVGPQEFDNDKVRIECNRQPNSVVYDITIKDPELTLTGVPVRPPSPPPPPPPAPPPKRGLLVAVVSIVVAVLAVVAAATLLAWRKGLGPWAAKSSTSEHEAHHGPDKGSGDERGRR